MIPIETFKTYASVRLSRQGAYYIPPPSGTSLLPRQLERACYSITQAIARPGPQGSLVNSLHPLRTLVIARRGYSLIASWKPEELNLTATRGDIGPAIRQRTTNHIKRTNPQQPLSATPRRGSFPLQTPYRSRSALALRLHFALQCPRSPP